MIDTKRSFQPVITGLLVLALLSGCNGVFGDETPSPTPDTQDTSPTMTEQREAPSPPFESRQEAIDYAKQNETVELFVSKHPNAQVTVNRQDEYWKLVWKSSGGIPSRLTVTINGTSGKILNIEQVQ